MFFTSTGISVFHLHQSSRLHSALNCTWNAFHESHTHTTSRCLSPSVNTVDCRDRLIKKIEREIEIVYRDGSDVPHNYFLCF